MTEPEAQAGPPVSADLIGARLRQLRRDSGRSLRSVAGAIGISPSALSQIETGAMQPSVNRLVEIVNELGAHVSAIFERTELRSNVEIDDGAPSEPIPGVVVSQNAAQTTLGQGVVYRRLGPVEVEGVDLLETTYPPLTTSSADGAMLVHQGYEIGLVVSGELLFEFSEGSVRVAAGGSIAFAATRPHRVANDSESTPAVALWFTFRNLESHTA